MTEKPLVSIILPVYNAEKYLKNAINSILNQTYSNIELLICDDYSNDSSRSIIEQIKDSRVKVFFNSSNIGCLKTCNLLFKLTNGEFVGFQDADDESDLSRIEKQIDFLLNNKDISLCGTNFKRSLSPNLYSKFSNSDYPINDSSIRKFIEINQNLPFCGSSVIFNRQILDDIGGYRDFYDRIGYEDHDWILLITEKYKVANLNDILYTYRYVPNSFSRNGLSKDYKKFYVKDICFFLKMQREINGEDGLSNLNLKTNLDLYLVELENKFKIEKPKNVLNLIKRSLQNKDIKAANHLFFELITEKRKLEFKYYYSIFLIYIKFFYKKIFSA